MIKGLKKINKENFNFDFKTNICKYIMIFLAGGIAGWIYELIFCLIYDGELVNRGFLYGPYLPVYGFGAIFLVILLKRFKKNPLIIFFSAMIITGVLEYFTGYAMWNIYHRTWWDYDGLFLNIDGYVCLRSVLTFAVGSILLVYVIEPLINKLISSISMRKMIYSSVFIVCMLLVDLICTLTFRNTL